jgi:hypothetical protein
MSAVPLRPFTCQYSGLLQSEQLIRLPILMGGYLQETIKDYLCHQDSTIFMRLPHGMGHLAPRLVKHTDPRGHTRAARWLAGPPLPPKVRNLPRCLSTHTGAWADTRAGGRLATPPLPRLGDPTASWAPPTETCRFKSGFASEGMLCNEPPIPLRVLDFLGTYELVNLSLVCKATHQAGHVLLEREVRGASLSPRQPT